MALKSFTEDRINDNVVVVSWVLTPGDTAVPYGNPDYADVSVSMEGTWGGATVSMTGTNGSAYTTLNDPFNVGIAFTSDACAAIVENTRYRKPSIASGSGSSVTVYLLARRTMRP